MHKPIHSSLPLGYTCYKIKTRKQYFQEMSPNLKEIYFKFHAIVQIRVLMQVGKDVKWSGRGNFPSK